MYKILIIDDEPGIVRGLAETLNREELDLEIYAATTVNEGLGIARKVKLDMLCSDINMPVMDGFQFANAVVEYWEECKVIFLTGYDTFDYVYKAVHEFGGNYVLKNDEDKFIDIVKKCISQVEKAQKNKLQQERLLRLIDENENNKKQRAWMEYLQEKDMEKAKRALLEYYKKSELNFEQPMTCALGRFLNRDTRAKGLEREIASYLLRLQEEYRYFYKLEAIFLYNQSYLIIAQERVKESPDLEEILTEIQNDLLEMKGEKVSFLYSENHIEMKDLQEQVKLYHTLLDVKWSRTNPVFIKLEDLLEENNMDVNSSEQYGLQIDKLLMERKFTELTDIFLALYLSVKNTQELSLADTQMYYKCIGIVASYIEKHVKYTELPEELQRSYYHLRYMTGIHEIHEFVMNFLKYMDLCQGEKEGEDDEQVIQRVEFYILNHITEEITLNSLARLVYLNPSYLSRFYKAITGRNLSHFIKDAKMMKAKELLKHSDKKIEDISRLLGFESAGYFTVLFKKQMGMTPTEYRNNP